MIPALVLTVAVGVVLGTMGSGGSIVMVPVLVYVAGLTPGDAVVVSLAVVGSTSLLGAWLRLRAGQFHWRAVKFLSLTGMAGALLGARGTPLVDPQLLMLLFAALMLAVGISMLRARDSADRVPRCRPLLCMTIGAVIGVLTGFLGVGGGFMIVPALVFLAGIDTASAIGASLAIIALNSFGGLLGHLDAVAGLWRDALLYLLAAVGGMLAGARLGTTLPERTLQKGFGALVLAVGGAIAVTTLWALA
ncbi:MAG: sulfite exporter TauE/SafE family protein [Candidatus Binatia bacterium]